MTDITEFNEEQDRIDRGEAEALVKEGLAADVKSKIADMIHGSTGQQIIASKDALDYLVRIVGKDIACILCSISNADLVAFRKTKPTKRAPRIPTSLQTRNIAAAYMIVDTLVAVMPQHQARQWLVNYDEYLFGIPAIELRVRPEDVRMAALHLIMGS